MPGIVDEDHIFLIHSVVVFFFFFFFLLDLVERNAVTGTFEQCLMPVNINVFSLFRVS